MKDRDLTRRTLFAAGAMGSLAAVASGAAAEAEPSSGEAANVKLVKDFCATWSAADFDADAVMAKYLAADCSVRPIDSQPFLAGPSAVATAFKRYAPHGERYGVDFRSTWAKGPIVVTDRIDTVLNGDKAGEKVSVVGVFCVRDGKIKEWTDYILA